MAKALPAGKAMDSPGARLEGSAALVAGSGRGIGQACGFALARAGALGAVTNASKALMAKTLARIAAPAGRIDNIASIERLGASRGQLIYSVTKTAVVGLCDPAASYATGAILPLGGGLMARNA